MILGNLTAKRKLKLEQALGCGNPIFDDKAVARIRERHDSVPQTAVQTFLQGTLVPIYSIQHKP
jgi:ribosomal protein S26